MGAWVQVYVPETGACVRRDKYWGRALSEAGLRDALRDFFAAGAGLRARVVRHVLRDLDALRRAIAKQTSYRFYSWLVLIRLSPFFLRNNCLTNSRRVRYCSSLLIVYEGDVASEPAEEASGPAGEYDADASSSSAELPAGHFDMSTLHDEISTSDRSPFRPHCEETMGGYEDAEPASQSPRRLPPSPDSADSWMAYSSTSSESWRGDAESEAAAAEARGKRARTWAPPGPAPPGATPPRGVERVDIRMIDFAHTAFAGADAESPLATNTPHHGPDCGFLTGIDSLKRLLTEILPPQPYS